MERIDNRNHNQLRDITIEPNVNIHAEGSVLISFGNTKVICNASIETVSYTHLTLPTNREV